MIISVLAGVGAKDRDLHLRPTPLKTLREYWRSRNPNTLMVGSESLRKRHHEGDSCPDSSLRRLKH